MRVGTPNLANLSTLHHLSLGSHFCISNQSVRWGWPNLANLYDADSCARGCACARAGAYVKSLLKRLDRLEGVGVELDLKG